MNPVNFFLVSESFENNSYSENLIYEKIVNLDKINNKINELKDKLFRDDNSIYYVDIFNGLRVHEFITNPSIKPFYKQKLRMILERHTKSYTDENIDKDVGFHKVDGSLISTLNELIDFYYVHIENIHDEKEFVEMLKLHFPKLAFKDNIEESIKTLHGGGLEFFAKDIIKTLICLENEFKTILEENHKDVRKSLVKLSSTIGLETTIEGNVKRKPDFTFQFKKDDGSLVPICCEPHVKLCNSSKSSDNTHYFNRLHFHVGQEGVENGKILIGSIGYHL